ncbi:MAG: putative porin [Shewanella sp.]|nr:putative porin [Shewanella sp.]
MKKSILSLAVLLGLVSTSVNAAENLDSSNTFQHEANVTLGTHTDELDNGLWSLDYRFYFSPVDTDNSPYALNGFLAQKSNIGAQYAQMSMFTDTVSYSIDGTYVLDSNWFIGVNYKLLDMDYGNSSLFAQENEASEYGLRLGYYFNETSEVSFTYQSSSMSGESSYTWLDDTHKSSSDSDSKIYSAQVHSFVPLASFSGLDLLASWRYIDTSNKHNISAIDGEFIREIQNNSTVDTSIVTLAADWYITKSWSVGAGYIWRQYDMEGESIFPDEAYKFSDDDTNSSYSVSTSYWWQISQSFAAKFSAAKQFGVDGDNEPDGFLVGATINGRF